MSHMATDFVWQITDLWIVVREWLCQCISMNKLDICTLIYKLVPEVAKSCTKVVYFTYIAEGPMRTWKFGQGPPNRKLNYRKFILADYVPL